MNGLFGNAIGWRLAARSSRRRNAGMDGTASSVYGLYAFTLLSHARTTRSNTSSHLCSHCTRNSKG